MDERLRRRARTGPASGDPAQRLHDLLRAGRLSTEALTCASALGEPAARELCRRLDLAGSDEAVVVSLSRLAGAEGITRLDLRGHPLGGPTLKPLETLPELRALDLDGKPHGVTAKALKGLRDLPLTHLRVGGCMLYDPDLAQLGAFPSLTHLDLQRTAAGAQTLDALVRRGTLRALDLSRCSEVLPDLVAELSKLPQLEELSLGLGPGVSAASLSALGERSGLRRLTLTGARVEGGAALKALRSLRRLDLCECRWVDDATPLTQLSLLAHLELSWCGLLSDEGVRALASLSQLEHLGLAGREEVSAETLRALGEGLQLRSLDLGDAADLEAPEALGAFETLERLHLDGALLPEEGYEAVGRLPRLERLTLRGTDPSRADLKALSGAPALRELDLRHNERITDASLSLVAELPRLEWLDLRGCTKLTLAGFERLRGHPTLRGVCPPERHAGDALRERLPGIEQAARRSWETQRKHDPSLFPDGLPLDLAPLQ